MPKKIDQYNSSRQIQRLFFSFCIAIFVAYFLNIEIKVSYQQLSEAGSVQWFAVFVGRLQSAGRRITPLVSMAALLIVIVLYFTFQKKLWRFSPSAMIVSLLFGVLDTLGLSIQRLESFAFLTENRFQNILSAGCILSYAFLMYVALLWLYHGFSLLERHEANASHPRLSRLKWTQTHDTLFLLLLLLLCWAPYYIAFYPGGLTQDAAFQLARYRGLIPMTNISPVYHTYFLGFMVQVGQIAFHSENIGLFLYILFQVILCAYCYSAGLAVIRALRLPKWFCWLCFAFYALTPLFITYQISVWKDPLFAALLVWLLSLSIRFLLLGERSIHLALRFVLCAILFGLIRNGALFLLIIAGILFAIYILKNIPQASVRMGALLTITIPIAIVWFLTNPMLAYLNVAPSPKTEFLSVPFQQIGRYVSIYGDTLTEDEKQSIDAVLDYSRIKEIYNPYLADSIKTLYRANRQDDETGAIREFLKTWLRLGVKHPRTYLEALVSVSCPYYTISDRTDSGGIKHGYILKEIDGVIQFDLSMPEALDTVRDIMHNYAELYCSLPIVNGVSDMSLHTWCLLAMIGYLFDKRRYQKLLLTLLPFLILLACMASPIAFIRYILPVCAATPLLLAVCGSADTSAAQ